MRLRSLITISVLVVVASTSTHTSNRRANAQSSAEGITASTRHTFDITVTENQGLSPQLGMGYSIAHGSLTSPCARATPRVTESGGGSVARDRRDAQSMIEERIAMSAQSRTAAQGFGASGSIRMSRALLSRETSIVEVIRAHVVTREVSQDAAADALAPSVSSDDPSFTERCGDGVVTQIRQGGEIIVITELSFATRAERVAFGASGSFSTGLAGGSFQASLQRSSWEGRLSIHMEAYQLGGRPQNLLAALGSDVSGSCSVTNLVACERQVANISNYIASQAEHGFIRNVTDHPADLTYTVTPWSVLGVTSHRDTPEPVLDSRRRITAEIIRLESLTKRFEELEGRQFYGAPAAIRNRATQAVGEVRERLRGLYRGLASCFRPEAAFDGCVSTASNIAQSNPEANAFDVPLAQTVRGDRTDFVAERHVTGNWGRFTPMVMCPAGQFAIGYAQRVEPRRHDGDDTALNSVRITCADYERASQQVVTSEIGHFGEWFPARTCDRGPITGFRIGLEQRRGRGDDTGGNWVRAACLDGTDIEAPGSGPWATGERGDSCPAGTAVCGLSIQLEPPQGNGDDTAMNGIGFACCAL